MGPCAQMNNSAEFWRGIAMELARLIEVNRTALISSNPSLAN